MTKSEKHAQARLKKHLDANRELAIRKSRAAAFVLRLKTHMAHPWNVFISEDGKTVICHETVVCLGRMLKELGLKKAIRDRNVNQCTGKRQVWGYLDFRIARDFKLVPKRTSK